MNISLILIIVGLLAVFNFMNGITLKNELEGLQKEIQKQKSYLKNIEYKIEIKNNAILKEIQEGNNTIIHDLALLSNKVNDAKEDINKTTKQQVTRIIYLAPTLKK